MCRITLHLRSGAVISFATDAIVACTHGPSTSLAPVLVICPAAGDIEVYDLERVDIEALIRQAVMGIERRP
ncbi:MAG: hypothetical protein R3B09_20060 [Nannocystaceae bacterium]